METNVLDLTAFRSAVADRTNRPSTPPKPLLHELMGELVAEIQQMRKESDAAEAAQ